MEVITRALLVVSDNVLDIEKRADLSDDQKVQSIIRTLAGVCAVVACQPLPFADIFALTPIQAYMGSKIAAIRGVPISASGAQTAFMELASVVGMGFLAQQLIVGGYKTVIPYFGAPTTMPLVFGATYAMGRVMDAYFSAKAQGQDPSKDELREIWKSARQEGEREARSSSSEIKREASELLQPAGTGNTNGGR